LEDIPCYKIWAKHTQAFVGSSSSMDHDIAAFHCFCHTFLITAVYQMELYPGIHVISISTNECIVTHYGMSQIDHAICQVATQEACYACDEYLHGIVTIISITIIIPIIAAQASCEEGLFQRIVGIMVYLLLGGTA